MNSVNKMSLNVVIMFTRMAFTVGIGLYTVRILIGALGKVDYGLYGLLGGGAAMLTVIQNSLVQSAERHLAYSLGKDDKKELQAVFSTTLLLFLLGAILVLFIGIILSPVILQVFNFPDDRRTAVLVTWIVFVASFSMIVLRSPFISLFTARQAMGQESLFATLNSLLLLSITIIVFHWDGDRLILYGLLLFAVRLLQTLIYATVGFLRFPESRPSFQLLSREKFFELLSFGSWSMLDAISLRLRGLGGNIVINVFFSPIVNAAYTLGTQLQNQELTMSKAIQRASNPAIIQSYARGQGELLKKLVLSVGRVSTLALATLCVPIILEVDFLLGVWVPAVPEYTAAFCVLMLLTILVEQTSLGFVSANQATGDIRAFNLATLLFIILPICSVAVIFWFEFGGPVLMTAAILGGMVLNVVFRAWHVGQKIDLPFSIWLGRVFAPCVLAVTLSALIGLGIQHSVGVADWQRLAVVCLGSWVSLAVLGWTIVLVDYEKSKIRQWVTTVAFRRKFSSNSTQENNHLP